MGAYGPPVDQLLKLGDVDEAPDGQWLDYAGMGIGPEEIPDLIRMADDPELKAADYEDPRSLAFFHAWRVLGQLHAEEAIPTLVGVIANQDPDDWDDWVIEELPAILAMIGPAATFDLTAIVEREDASRNARADACRCLAEIAVKHPGEREGVVATLVRWLERAEWHEPISNGFVVSDLIQLKAKEAAEVIERAYAAGFVDPSICGVWYDVWYDLELEGEPPPGAEQSYRHRINPSFFDLDDYDLEEPEPYEPLEESELPQSWQPTEIRTPDERKDRNKARQKLEKKVKGKGKGGKGR